jgi:hypothetical protein
MENKGRISSSTMLQLQVKVGLMRGQSLSKDNVPDQRSGWCYWYMALSITRVDIHPEDVNLLETFNRLTYYAVGVQMMLLSNIVHLTLPRMGILLVKSYEVYCKMLDRVRFALVIRRLENDIYYWCYYIECKTSLLLNTDGRYKSHWDRLLVLALDAQHMAIRIAFEPTICIIQWSWRSFSDRYLSVYIQYLTANITSGDITGCMPMWWYDNTRRQGGERKIQGEP